MAAINTVTLIGRVVCDIEVNSTIAASVAPFALAVDGYGQRCRRKFHRLRGLNKAAELLGRVRTERQILGHNQADCVNENLEKDDIKRKATEVIIDQFRFERR